MTSVRQHGPPQHAVITLSEKAFCKLSCYVVRVWYNVCSISNKPTKEHVMTPHDLYHDAIRFWLWTGVVLVTFFVAAYVISVVVWFVRNR